MQSYFRIYYRLREKEPLIAPGSHMEGRGEGGGGGGGGGGVRGGGWKKMKGGISGCTLCCCSSSSSAFDEGLCVRSEVL